jgi:protein phosphatase
MVADGMGGHGGGDIASQSAVDAIANYLVHVLPCAETMLASLPSDERSSLHGVRCKLSSALLAADEAIRLKSETVATSDMGTTLTMAFVLDASLYVAHVGDSRCYRYRGGQLEQLTNDHTMANQLAQMGDPFVEEAQQLNHILWNCLGGGEDVRPCPEVFKTDLLLGDGILLCTDGLTNELSEAEIGRELAAQKTSKEICESLIQAANLRGAEDNVTAVLAKLQAPH